MTKELKHSVCALLLVACSFLCGCRLIVDSHDMKKDMMAGYMNGMKEQVYSELEARLKPPSFFNSSMVGTGDELVWRLESGMANFIYGNDEQCIQNLARAEAIIEEYDGRAVVSVRDTGEEGMAIATNSAALPYRGTPRDRIMLPLVKALAYLGKLDEEGFRVELFSLRESQQAAMDANEKFLAKEAERLESERKDNPQAVKSVNLEKMLAHSKNAAVQEGIEETRKLAYTGYGNCLNPLAIFMSAYGYSRESDFENAIVDYQRLYKVMPEHLMVQRYLVTVLRRTGREIPAELANVQPLEFMPGQGTVLVVFANGRGAALRETSLYVPIIMPRRSSLIAAAWPVCEYHAAPFSTVSATMEEGTVDTVAIANMDAILAQEYTQAMPSMLSRLIISVAVKEIAYQLTMRGVKDAPPLARFFADVSGIAYKLTFNTADTRCWETLPKEFQVAEFPLPKSRKMKIKMGPASETEVAFPENAKSAIVYVNAPSGLPGAFTLRVFPITSH